MPKITMTQWWELLEANLVSLSTKLDVNTRESLKNSAPWMAAMNMATKGKVIEQKGLWFAVKNGATVEREMKQLAEGLGDNGLPNVTDTTSLLFALCYADYMPQYTNIESSVPFITGFLQRKVNVDLVAARAKTVKERILNYYQKNKELVEAIPGIRQMPGIGLLNLPVGETVETASDSKKPTLEILEEKLSEQALKLKSVEQQKENIKENLNLINAFITDLYQDSSDNINKLLKQHPQVVQIVTDSLNAAALNSSEHKTCNLIQKLMSDLKPGYLPHGIRDLLPRFIIGCTYKETKTLLIKTLENEYLSQIEKGIKSTEETIVIETSKLTRIQQEMDSLIKIQRKWAATYFTKNYFTLVAETPDLVEMTKFSARLDQLTQCIDALIEIKNLENKGQKANRNLIKKYIHITPDSSEIIDYFFREKIENLELLRNDAKNGKKLVDSYCDTFKEAQKLNDSQIKPNIIQYLAITYPLIKAILTLLPSWISKSTLDVVEQFNENNKKIAEVEETLKFSLTKIKAIPFQRTRNNGKNDTDYESVRTTYTHTGQTKVAFFNKEPVVGKKEVANSQPDFASSPLTTG